MDEAEKVGFPKAFKKLQRNSLLFSFSVINCLNNLGLSNQKQVAKVFVL